MKCGKEFPDDTNFCPACGEKLESINCCPKCGAPINEDDKFCKACGEKLVKEEEIKKEEQSVPVPKKEERAVDPEENKRKANRVINIVVSAIMLFATTFLLIGALGDVVKLTSSSLGVNTSIGLKYFISDYPKTLSQMYDAYPYKEYFAYSVAMFIVESILYYGGSIACLILTIFGIIKNIRSITKKEEPHTKIMFAAGAAMLPIILFMLARMKVESSYASVNLGWGAGLIVTGLVFILIGISAYRVAKAIINKENVASTIVSTAMALVIFILMLNMFFPLSTLKQTVGGQTVRMSTSGIVVAESALAAFSSSSGVKLNLSVFIPGVLSFVFTLVGLVMIFLAYINSLKGKKVSSIVFSAVTFLVLIISASLSISACISMYSSNSNITYGFSGAAVSGIVMLNFVIAGLIVSACLNKKKEA